MAPEEAEALRNGKSGIILRDIFIGQLIKLNPDSITRENAKDLIRNLGLLQPTIEGNLNAWEYLKGLKTVFVQEEKREKNIKFIDTKDINNNKFHITEEYEYTNGKYRIRPDIILFINGFPVVIVEAKAPYIKEGIPKAFNQIKRYHREGPELMAILQIYSLTHLIRYFYSPTWNISEKGLLNWKDEKKGNFEEVVKAFIDRTHISRVISDFILFSRSDDELKKFVMRPHQMRAVSKLVERASDPNKKRGLIWHTQGSGKTYTMILTAKALLENQVLQNPTVLMLVDRNELESQLFGNLSSMGIDYLEVAESKDHLRRLLSEDRRGLIVSMIHKFEGMPENINKRGNIFVLVDEAHRTTGGKLGNFLMGALPNATYLGFTGTPIDRTSHGSSTFITFGKDDLPKGYLDKYGIAESIDDGTTVPLNYTLAPNKLLVDREVLEKEFLDIKEAEGVSDIDQLNKILERAVTLKTMMKSPQRIDEIAKYVAMHYKDYIEPMGYKAFLVGVDREACALYKSALDKYLPEEYSSVVYSPAQNDSEELSRYHLSTTEEKEIRKSFRSSEKLPKILIVTEKLLTGFDAPILYCMYLDKPMRDHVLLQAIARVNRPYEDKNGKKKRSGFVLDFVGIFSNLKKALAFDETDITGAVHDIKTIKDHFIKLHKELSTKYLSIGNGLSGDKKTEAIIDHFLDKNARESFYKEYKELETSYEILSPDSFLRPFIQDMIELTRIYEIVREMYEPHVPIDKEISRKTMELVQANTSSSDIRGGFDIYEINSDTIEKIKKEKRPDKIKIFNTYKSLDFFIEKNVEGSPYLLSIGQKAEDIVSHYLERQTETKETLDGLLRLTEEIEKAEEEKEKLKMPLEIFSVYWILRDKKIKNAEKLSWELKDTFEKYPSWKESEQHEREIRKVIYQMLIHGGIEDPKELNSLAKETMNLLKGVPNDNT